MAKSADFLVATDSDLPLQPTTGVVEHFAEHFLETEAHLSVVDLQNDQVPVSACRAEAGKIDLATRRSSRSPESRQRLVDPEIHASTGIPFDLSEPELRIEGTCGFIDRIDGDEPSGRLRPGIGRPFDGLDQQISAEPLSLLCVSNGETGQQHHADIESG